MSCHWGEIELPEMIDLNKNGGTLISPSDFAKYGFPPVSFRESSTHSIPIPCFSVMVSDIFDFHPVRWGNDPYLNIRFVKGFFKASPSM